MQFILCAPVAPCVFFFFFLQGEGGEIGLYGPLRTTVSLHVIGFSLFHGCVVLTAVLLST